MRRVICTVIAVVLWSCVPVAAVAQQALSPELVAQIKAATVFVKIKAGELAGSGSGFVIHVDGDATYIATNRHVVEPKVAEIVVTRDPRSGRRGGMRRGPGMMPGYRGPFAPPLPVPGPPGFQQEERPRYSLHVVVHEYKNTEVTAVFQSGTKDEESATGNLVAVDPDEDLAVVVVKGVKQSPRPIEYVNSPQLAETMPVYTFGFPLGEELSTGKRNPAITVGKGSVSSLRNDDDGNLSKVQLDAALNHGNSGGPVVDAQGRLIGVANSRIEGDNAENISFAVPARAVVRLMQGRLAKPELTAAKNDDGMTIHVAVPLVDPLQKIKSAEFRYLAASAVPIKPKPSDSLAALHGCHTLKLKIENCVASGEIALKKGITTVSLLDQTVSTDKEGHRATSDNWQDSVALAAPRPAPNIPNMPSAAVAGETRPSPVAGAIGIHFTGLGGRVTGTAGVAPMSNWNSPPGLVFAGYPLVDNSGARCGATFSIKGAASIWRSGNANHLLDGYVASSDFKPMTLTINHIPYSRYAMYVYVGDATPGNEAKVTVNGKTYYYTPEGGVPVGYAAITNTDSKTHQLGNFIEVVGLTGANQTVELSGTTQQYSGLCGVEIVNMGLPVRSTGARPAPPVATPAPRTRGRSAPFGNPQPRIRAERVFGGAGPQFRDTAPEKGMLVGFEVGLGKWAGTSDVVSAIRPIYVDQRGREVLGDQHGKLNGRKIRVRAKRGYAVGAITAKSVAALDGFSVTFMKVKNGRLDPDDSYESEWVGGGGSLPQRTASGNGAPAIGIAGRGDDANCAAMGLIFAPPTGE